MKILKRNQIIISVLALMLITVGYMSYTSNIASSIETGILMDAEKVAGIGDAKLVNSSNVVEDEENENDEDESLGLVPNSSDDNEEDDSDGSSQNAKINTIETAESAVNSDEETTYNSTSASSISTSNETSSLGKNTSGGDQTSSLGKNTSGGDQTNSSSKNTSTGNQTDSSSKNAATNNQTGLSSQNILKENNTYSSTNTTDNETNSSTKTTSATNYGTDYFVTSKLERDKMYSQMLETYQGLVESSTISVEQKNISTQEIANINNRKNSIMISENLIKNLGFEDVVIFVNDNSTSVIVKAEKLSEADVAQIQNIVCREIGVEADVIHISLK